MQQPWILAGSLRNVLPKGGRFRLSVREGERWISSCETESPVGDLQLAPDTPPGAECRIEQADAAGEFSTLVPFFRLQPPVGDIAVAGPQDSRGLPVRLMIYDSAEGGYVADYAQFGTDFRVDATTLPMEHLLRTRFYLWNTEERGWRPTGCSRRLPGSGKLGRPVVQEEHRRRAEALLSRLHAVLAPETRPAGGLIEFYDHVDFLADVPAEADDDALRETLAELVAGASESSLRARVLVWAEGDAKAPGPLVELFDLGPAFDGLYSLLRYGGGHEARDIAMPLLDLTTRDDGPALASMVSSQLFRFLPEGVGFEAQHWRPAPIEPLLEQWDARPDGSRLIGEFLNYYWLYAQLQQEAAERKRLYACFFDPEHLRNCIDPVLARIETMPARRKDFYGTRMFRAKLASLRDREAAAAMFAEALKSDSPLRAAATFDGGAATYFSHRQITEAAPVIEARRAALLGELRVLSEPASGRRTPLFLFSTDLRFLAIYLPQWLAQADYCKARDLDFHFVVIGDPAEVSDALAKAEDLRRVLAAVRGVSPDTYADNVSYSAWTTPSWCAEPVTFYACARYIALGELTRRLGRDILVQDMDFTLKDDPAEFLSNFPLEGFGVQASYGLYGIDAWRRVMGGTFFAPDRDGAREGLKALEAYLIEGLARGRSWYLDQNALAYFLERAREARFPLRQLKLHRPTEQPRINRMFEALQP